MLREPGYGAGCRIALVSSRQDPAGVNIGGCVRDLLDRGPGVGYPDHGFRFIPMEVEERLIWQDGIDRHLSADLICFLSRHSSERPSPVLTTHVTGNFRTAAFGGVPGSLAPAAPAFMQAVLAELSVNAPPGYRVSYEVTHHGPTELDIPSLFVEIGSDMDEWQDRDAGMAVARSVLSAAPCGDAIPLIGFGGTHYARRETEIALGSRGAFGHIAHSRELAFVTPGQVALMRDRTGAVAAYIDKKAVPATDFARVDRLLAGSGLVRLTEGDITGMGGLSWAGYLKIREMAARVVPGSHPHVDRLAGDGTASAIEVEPGLLRELSRTDPEGLRKIFAGLPVVHLTGQDGAIVPVFFSWEPLSGQVLHDLISSCVKLITIKEDTAIEGDHLIIRRRRFDPVKAAGLMVPKGPLYSVLMQGGSITVEGRTITPEMVQTCHENTIHIPGLERFI